MNYRKQKLYLLIGLFLLGAVVSVPSSDAQKAIAIWKPEIPKTWIDDEIAALEIPLSNSAHSPKHISADYYYRIPKER